MHTTRLEIMKLIQQSPSPKAVQVKEKISEYYGEMTFGLNELETEFLAAALAGYKAALTGQPPSIWKLHKKLQTL